MGGGEPLGKAGPDGLGLYGHALLSLVDAAPALGAGGVGLPLSHPGAVEDVRPEAAAVGPPSAAAVAAPGPGVQPLAGLGESFGAASPKWALGEVTKRCLATSQATVEGARPSSEAICLQDLPLSSICSIWLRS